MKHPWNMEIQICTNTVPVVINGGDIVTYRHKMYIGKSLENVLRNNR